jgi:hypothetical protein
LQACDYFPNATIAYRVMLTRHGIRKFHQL